MDTKARVINSIPISMLEEIAGVKVVIEPHELNALLILMDDGKILKLAIEDYCDTYALNNLYKKTQL